MKHTAFLLVLGAAFLCGCSLIDEDQSDCGKELGVDYELRLVTNVSTELEAKLGMSTELSLSAALRTHLQSVFTDHADDVDLSFYDVEGDSLRLHHEQHQMDASRTSYSLYIPVRRYMHLAVANVQNNGPVRLERDEACHPSVLVQEKADTVDSQRTGLFTARLPMDIEVGKDQQFDVRLYMANCATALVLDTTQVHVKDIKVFAKGFASSFSIADSLYHFTPGTVVRTEKVTPAKGSNENTACFAAVTFPTRDAKKKDSKVIIETPEIFDYEFSEDVLFELHVLVTLFDGTTTLTELRFHRPVKAGQLLIINGLVREDGSANTDDPTVGVSVTLDWKQGMTIDVPL